MTFRIIPAVSRRPAGCALRSGAHPVGVGILVFLLFNPVFTSAAPLGCLTSANRRICVDGQVVRSKERTVSIVSYDNAPHPATVKGSEPVPGGQRVRSIPVDDLLPWYWELRRSQLGIGPEKDVKEEKEKEGSNGS